METEKILEVIQNAANTIATPNWADILSATLSLFAILVAGFVAWKQNKIAQEQVSIADKQNRIALFEKRLEIYDILSSCAGSVPIIKLADNKENILRYLFISFADNTHIKNTVDDEEMRLYLISCSTKLQQARFLFSEKIVPYITEVSVDLLILANADGKTDDPNKFYEKKEWYLEAVKNLDENEVFKNIKTEMEMF